MKYDVMYATRDNEQIEGNKPYEWVESYFDEVEGDSKDEVMALVIDSLIHSYYDRDYELLEQYKDGFMMVAPNKEKIEYLFTVYSKDER